MLRVASIVLLWKPAWIWRIYVLLHSLYWLGAALCVLYSIFWCHQVYVSPALALRQSEVYGWNHQTNQEIETAFFLKIRRMEGWNPFLHNVSILSIKKLMQNRQRKEEVENICMCYLCDEGKDWWATQLPEKVGGHGFKTRCDPSPIRKLVLTQVPCEVDSTQWFCRG